MKTIVFGLVCALAAQFVQAQNAKELTNYKLAATAKRQEVWSWKKPEFGLRHAPDSLRRYSQVVLARHREVDVESNATFAYLGINPAPRKPRQITNVYRELVLLNDKAAVEAYSQVSYKMFSKTSTLFFTNRAITILGIRIIKPDGKMQEVSADELVITNQNAGAAEGKLAIPDLAPGDLLDYFVATLEDVQVDYDPRHFQVLMASDFPVLHSSFHASVGKKFAVRTRTYNGAPEMVMKEGPDEEKELTVQASNLPGIGHAMWTAPLRQLPLIRFSLILGYKGPGSQNGAYSRPGSVVINGPVDQWLKDIEYYVSTMPSTGMETLHYPSDFKKDLETTWKRLGLNWSKMSDVEKADFIYEYARYKRLHYMGGSPDRAKRFAHYDYQGSGRDLAYLLKQQKVPADLYYTTPPSGFAPNEIKVAEDLTPVVHLAHANLCYNVKSIFAPAHSLDDEASGGGQYFIHPELAASKNYKGEFIEPVSVDASAIFAKHNPATSNQRNVQLRLVMNVSGLIQVQRRVQLTGAFKHDVQARLITFENMINRERAYFREPDSVFVDALAKGDKYAKRLSPIMLAQIEEQRLEQKQAFAQEAGEAFEGLEVSEVHNTQLQNLGTHHTAPDFVYSSDFALNGLVKKAGNNLIVEIGRLQGAPSALKPEQRQRGNLDVYMPFARTIRYEVSLALPASYSAAGIEALNKKVENASGHFISTATQAGNEVKISISRRYNNRFEPAASWPQLLAILDAGDEFQNAKLLLKKI